MSSFRPLAIPAGLLLVVALGLIGSFAILERRRDAHRYWYDVERGYRYSFASSTVVRVPVTLETGSMKWPSGAVPCDTAFLHLEVDSNWPARWFEPAVVVSSTAGSRFTQHFERGARGARFLNLSPLCDDGVAPDDRIGLLGRYLTWRPGSAELLLFENPALRQGSLLVLAPHPDDAEIAAFGLYRGRNAAVVTITAGDYDNRSYQELAPNRRALRRLVGRVRTWDSVAGPIWGGVDPDRSVNLGYLTGTLPEMAAAPSSEAGVQLGGTSMVRSYRSQNTSSLVRRESARSTWESLVEDLSHLLDQLGPTLIATPHPLLDRSADHRVSTLALLEALSRLNDREARLLLYNNHHAYSEYYPYGPADSLVTLPPWFGERSSLEFGSVFSHLLSEEAIIDKVIVLGIMHDLREPPRREIGAAIARPFRRFFRVVRDVLRDPNLSYSYFRRATRPNELFFVVDPGMRDDLEAAARALPAG